MPLTKAIHRPTLHEELVERLRNLIVEDTLKPGEKVPEKDLCEAFGVSRTPLREALKVLASEGLVVLRANRGASVAEVTREELEETFPVIAVLEELVGELACRNLSQADIEKIRKRHGEMVAAYRAKDRKSYFQANQDIHNALIEGAGNGILETHHRLLASRVRRARFMANLSEDRWAQAIEEHEQMMQKLDARDAEGLGQLMKQHMMNKYAANIRALESAVGEATEE